MALSRAARSWSQLALQVCLLLVGLALVQVVAERLNRRFDLTPARSLSLSPVTRKVLAQVSAPLKLTVFHRRTERARYADLLARVRIANPRVAVDLYDLDRYPDRARGLGVTQYGQAAIEYEGRRIVTPALPEEELAGGILHALRGRSRRLVFTTAHGERPPGGGQESYGRLTAALESENYSPETITLLDGAVPPGTDVLVVAGPTRDFLPSELEVVAAYLRRGGGALVLLEPGRLPNLESFLGAMGVRVGDDFIVDRERRVLGTDGLAAIVELFKRGNPISDAIETGVVLPSARTIDAAQGVPGVDAESIARTGPSTWAIADPARARRGDEPSQAKHDVPGSASVVVMAEIHPGDGHMAHRPGRLLVVGDADFASDAYLDLLGNRDLALNAVAWATGEETLAGLRPKRMPEIMRPLSPLVLTERQARAILVGVTIVEPGLVLIAGLVLVGLRRRRG
jgi:ABC-type uncharacterized transport system involved in gliding motility auxiliary subunit